MNTLTICPHCQALNRVDTQKALKKEATCGKCSKELDLSGLVSKVDARGFERILAKADKPVVVDFWASWCGPCQMYGPEFEAASTIHQDAIFLKVNTEQDPHLSQRLGIRGIPATIVFKNGQEVKRQAGAMSKDQLINFIKGA